MGKWEKTDVSFIYILDEFFKMKECVLNKRIMKILIDNKRTCCKQDTKLLLQLNRTLLLKILVYDGTYVILLRDYFSIYH